MPKPIFLQTNSYRDYLQSQRDVAMDSVGQQAGYLLGCTELGHLKHSFSKGTSKGKCGTVPWWLQDFSPVFDSACRTLAAHAAPFLTGSWTRPHFLHLKLQHGSRKGLNFSGDAEGPVPLTSEVNEWSHWDN